MRHCGQQVVHRVLDSRFWHAVEDGGGEHVHTAIDQVRDERLGLLDEVGDAAGAVVGDNHAVPGVRGRGEGVGEGGQQCAVTG
jgi:hypothetical protein